MSKPLPEARGAVEQPGRVQALQEADLTARPGEAVSPVGDNGSGGSAPVNVPPGVSRDDSPTTGDHAGIPAAPLGGTPSSGR